MWPQDRVTLPVVHRLLALVAVAVVLTVAFVVGAGAGSRSTVLWDGSFTSDASSWTALQAVPGSFKVVPAPGRTGNAGEFIVRPGDFPAGNAGERAEVLKSTKEAQGVESFWKWSVYFPQSFVSNPNASWNVFTQWHQGSNFGGPQPVSFEIQNSGGREQLRLRVWGGEPNGSSRRSWLLGPLVRGRWYDFAFHVVWAPDSNGLVELWLNGKRVVRPTHTATLYRGDGVYLKQGFYRAASSYVTTVLIARTQRLSSFAGVALGGTGTVSGGPRTLPDPDR